MRKEHVPQDHDQTTYGGGRKLLYAVDQDGRYVGVQSAGWEIEATATRSALEEMARQRESAWTRAGRGETAPLEYYMHYRRMDLALLAQTTGIWQWRIRRHLRPAVFARLGPRLLARYADALGLDAAVLRTLTRDPAT